jgi:ferredoxin-NADP reductase
MPQVRVPLRRRERIADQTMAFFFEKPKGWPFIPGQTIDVTLIDPPESDFEGDTRTFSIASAPHEPEIMVATRMRGSAFKRVLATMAIGSPVLMDEPIGSFVLNTDAGRPAVLLAGGIGVTPFRSIVLDAASRGGGPPIWLFYANHRVRDAAFLEEFGAAADGAGGAFELVPTMTHLDADSSWRGETGRIDLGMIRRHVPRGASPIYYIAGPSPMVASLHDTLVAAGIPKPDVRVEEFAGYA